MLLASSNYAVGRTAEKTQATLQEADTAAVSCFGVSPAPPAAPGAMWYAAWQHVALSGEGTGHTAGGTGRHSGSETVCCKGWYVVLRYTPSRMRTEAGDSFPSHIRARGHWCVSVASSAAQSFRLFCNLADALQVDAVRSSKLGGSSKGSSSRGSEAVKASRTAAAEEELDLDEYEEGYEDGDYYDDYEAEVGLDFNYLSSCVPPAPPSPRSTPPSPPPPFSSPAPLPPLTPPP